MSAVFFTASSRPRLGRRLRRRLGGRRPGLRPLRRQNRCRNGPPYLRLLHPHPQVECCGKYSFPILARWLTIRPFRRSHGLDELRHKNTRRLWKLNEWGEPGHNAVPGHESYVQLVLVVRGHIRSGRLPRELHSGPCSLLAELRQRGHSVHAKPDTWSLCKEWANEHCNLA